jgi:hypothetical protein
VPAVMSGSRCRIGSRPVRETQRKGNSELLFRSSTGMVPSATAELKIQLVMVREAGSDDDGLADNLSLVFTST